MSKKLLLAAAVFIVLVFLKNFASNQFLGYKTTSAVIGDHTYKLYIADSDSKRTKGLSGSKPLSAREGMLFIFAEKGQYSFWMKDMNYAIDIIFINDSKIVDAIEDVDPSTYPQSFTAKVPFDKVIETESDAMNFSRYVGKQIKF